jgi:hypothetical protein
MAKSGSTLAYEMVKGVLADAGHDQRKVRSSGLKPRRGNYIAALSREAVLDVIESIGPDRIVAAKTHMTFDNEMFAWLEDLQAQRKLQVFASYRDPRDMCLSLVDHGRRSREAGKGGDFAHIRDLDRAAEVVEKAITKFRKWASMQGSVKLCFDTVAFTPDDANSVIEKTLGVTADHDAVKRHAFEDAFTQKNTARKSRFETELGTDKQTALESRFSEFIDRVCRKDDPQWFSEYRNQLRAGALEHS